MGKYFQGQPILLYKFMTNFPYIFKVFWLMLVLIVINLQTMGLVIAMSRSEGPRTGLVPDL